MTHDIRTLIPKHIIALCRKALVVSPDQGRAREQALAAGLEWVADAPVACPGGHYCGGGCVGQDWESAPAQRTTGPSITTGGGERSCQPGEVQVASSVDKAWARFQEAMKAEWECGSCLKPLRREEIVGLGACCSRCGAQSYHRRRPAGQERGGREVTTLEKAEKHLRETGVCFPAFHAERKAICDELDLLRSMLARLRNAILNTTPSDEGVASGTAHMVASVCAEVRDILRDRAAKEGGVKK